MSANDSIERRLPGILTDLSAAPYPDYTDALLARTASARQRPGWVFAERWLPVSTLTSATATLPRFPWRQIVVVALLILALAVGAILIAGSRPTPLPAPFGPAANGLIAYSTAGDIYTVDPVTGETRAIVTGSDADSDPVWSRDGTRIVFKRAVRPVSDGQDLDASTLYVVRPDGTGLTLITSEPFKLGVQQYSFSPDGREVIFVGNDATLGDLYIAKADGGGVRRLEVGMAASDPSFRPPDGQEIVFEGTPTGNENEVGMFLVNTDGSRLRNLVQPSRTAAAVTPVWSPDGKRIAYSVVDFTAGWGWGKTHTMMADGTGQEALPSPTGSYWDYLGGWSNDGTRLVVIRGYGEDWTGPIAAAVVPADGSGTGVETDQQSFLGDSTSEWAPDDVSILVMRLNPSGDPETPLFIDPVTGAARPAPFPATSRSAWQRLALPSS
jgi:Tol biopolymer transport system component